MTSFRIIPSRALPIGIDLSSTGAKLLQLRRTGGKVAVLDALRVELPVTTEIVDPSKRLTDIIDAIRRRFPLANFRGRRCVIGVGRDVLRIRSIRQPRMPEDEADRAIRLEAPDRLGFSPSDQVEIGWIRAGEVRQSDQLRDEVIAVGAETELLESLVDSCIAIGLRPITIEPSFMSSARCFDRAGRREDDEAISRVLLDIGFGSTDLLVLRGSSIVFYKALKVGGRRMNTLVAERLGVSEADAADLRQRRIQPVSRRAQRSHDDRSEQAIFEAIRPVADELTREVSMCLRYYAVSFTGPRPSFVLMIGGDAGEPRLAEHVARGIGLPTRVGCPLEGVALAGSLLGMEDSALSGWAAAVGLSLCGANQSIERAIQPDCAATTTEANGATSEDGRRAA